MEIVIAEKQAEETRIAAEAERVRAAVEAEAQRLLNEAENVLTDQARYSLFRRKLLDRIEGIVRESVKPMEKIEGIRILQVDGLNGNGHGGNGGRSATDEVIDSALRYRVQAPLIDSLLADIGVEGGSLAKMPGLIREARDMQGIKESARKGGGGGGGGEKPAAAPSPSTEGEPPAERSPRKKS
ncbi:putative membrane protein YqiK [Bradyrhizobium sp. i1.3.6]